MCVCVRVCVCLFLFYYLFIVFRILFNYYYFVVGWLVDISYLGIVLFSCFVFP